MHIRNPRYDHNYVINDVINDEIKDVISNYKFSDGRNNLILA